MDLSLTQPSDAALIAASAAQAHGAFSYPDVGATRGPAPEGWPADRREIHLGSGAQAFARGVSALQAWTMFDLDWILMPPPGRPAPGLMVSFASRQYGAWMVHTCRVIYVEEHEDEREAVYAFGYGTLQQHAVQGEERFEVRWSKAQADDDAGPVTMAIAKFSRLRHPLVRLGAPLARRLQARFSEEALRRVRRAVRED